MNNKECVDKLTNPLESWEGQVYDPQAIDHAISRLEMLDRLEELLDKAQKVNDRKYELNRNTKRSVLIGQDSILVAVREFLVGDDKALKTLAEVEE